MHITAELVAMLVVIAACAFLAGGVVGQIIAEARYQRPVARKRPRVAKAPRPTESASAAKSTTTS